MIYRIHSIPELSSAYSWSTAFVREVARSMRLAEAYRKRTSSYLFKISQVPQDNHKDRVKL